MPNFRDEMSDKDLDRFERDVSMSYDSNGCLLWEGVVNNFNRGQFWINGRLEVAPRVMWSLHYNKDLPYRDENDKRVVIAHTCHNPQCVNPRHLVKTDDSGNMQMSLKAGRLPRGRKNSCSKLTEHIVKRCRMLHYKKGVSQRQLAKIYGVSGPTMHRAIVGETVWKHMEDA